MRAKPVLLTHAQQIFVQETMVQICQRGQWNLHIAAASGNHVHVLLDAANTAQPKAIRMWLKRWLGEALTAKWGLPPSGTWWAEGGSTKPVKDEKYLNNVSVYILKQRTLPVGES